jgi:hypothetical protein
MHKKNPSETWEWKKNRAVKILYSPPGISNGPPITGEQIIWWVICFYYNFLINELVPCFERFCINIGIKILSNVFSFFLDLTQIFTKGI